MALSRSINGATITLVKGDITDLETEAFVFYAQDDLELGSGFGAAITTRGGPGIKEELAAIGKVAPQGVVVSGAGNLKAEYILHANGPKFQEDDAEAKLKRTMENVLSVAEEKGIKTLAFPGMGTGFYGIPKPAAAKIMRETISQHVTNGSKMKEITICLLETRELTAFEAVFKE